jgi:hypothetical protein
VPLDEWPDRTWEEASVHLHPALLEPKVIELLNASVSEHRSINFKTGHDYPLDYWIDPILAKMLLDLVEGPRRYRSYLEGDYADFIHFSAMAAGNRDEVEKWLRMILIRLSDPLYIFIVPGAAPVRSP